jgi:hypothetical protein
MVALIPSKGSATASRLTDDFMTPILKTALLTFILFITVPASVKSWRGIVPLHSTRADVRRILGKPIFGGDSAIELYESEEGRIQVRYARQPCEEGLPADWGNWRIAKDTVVNISITLNHELAVAALKLRNFERLKWYTDNSGATYYRDKQRGIEYQVQGRSVTAITYGPSTRDRPLLCKRNVPLLRY